MNQKGLLKNMLRVKPYRPDELVYGLAPYLGDETLDIPGFHLFSFNDVERTEGWRQEMLADLGVDISTGNIESRQRAGGYHA